MFFIAEKTGNFRIQLVGNITFQSLSHEHDSCREAKLLYSSSDVFSLRWRGQSAILCWMPLARLQNAPTNSCGICTSLNLIYLRPLWEQRRRPSPGSHEPIFTCTPTYTHTHRLAHIFHFIESQAVLKLHICTCISALPQLISHSFAHSMLLFFFKISHPCLTLSVLFHTQL